MSGGSQPQPTDRDIPGDVAAGLLDPHVGGVLAGLLDPIIVLLRGYVPQGGASALPREFVEWRASALAGAPQAEAPE